MSRTAWTISAVLQNPQFPRERWDFQVAVAGGEVTVAQDSHRED